VIFFLVIVVIAVIGVVAAVAAGRGRGMSVTDPDRVEPVLPVDRDLTSADLARVRFAVGFRGYRMDQVDDLLERLSKQIDVHVGPSDHLDTYQTQRHEVDPAGHIAADEAAAVAESDAPDA
jgi:DivIVA domain-containing protein